MTLPVMSLNPISFSLAVGLFVSVAARAEWPQFRGPALDGRAVPPAGQTSRGLPLTWSETENVAWKTPIPHLGWSSPVVRDGKIWLTTATANGTDFFVLCVEEATGRVLLNEKLFHSETPEPLGNNVNCYASPSPAVEAGRVYVHFGSYGTACLDTESFRVLWKRADLPCRHFRGPGSSVVLHRDTVILTMDGIDQQYLVALSKRDGTTVWRTDRTTQFNDLMADGRPNAEGDFRKGFTTPFIAEIAGRMQLISAGSKSAFSYDPATGRELWKVRYGGHTPAMTAVAGGGLVFLSTGNSPSELLALRADGTGDVTDSHLAWKTTRGVPRMPSPILLGDRLYLVADNGVLSCLEAPTGRELWQERIGGSHYASPLYGDGRIYCFSNAGETVVVKPGDTLKVLARNQLADGFMASPAVSGHALILRTKTHLYRIAASAQ